jgi:hypothetical protein
MLVNVSHYYPSLMLVVRIRTNYEYNIKSYERHRNILKHLKIFELARILVNVSHFYPSLIFVGGLGTTRILANDMKEMKRQ